MIRLPPRSLDAATQQQLSQWQHEVDSLATYPARVETAKARFKERNKKGNVTFDVVRVQLVAMSHGARRCAYCEDSVGDEVEHIWPKDFFPERAFVWTNYLYACGGCNGAKLNRWRLRDAQGLLVGAPAADLTRRRDALRRDDHPMVWHEMKRQRAHHPDLADLFTRAPELLDW